MSLRTGTEVATALAPIINPNNLKIEGFFCKISRRDQPILVSQDIRDMLPQGIVINDQDVLTDASELVRLEDILRTNFELIGKHVETTSGQKLGKVNDYATETSSMFIKKLYVSQPIYKNFSGGTLGIDRTQIVEITDKKIVVNDLDAKVPAGAHAVA
jgi:sporulation protein YlmC with PRC-barrel domain